MKEHTHWSRQGFEEREREGKGECGSSEVNALLRCKWARRGSFILLLEHTTTRLKSSRLTSEQVEEGTVYIDKDITLVGGDSKRIRLKNKYATRPTIYTKRKTYVTCETDHGLICNNERHAQAICWMTDVCAAELRSHVIDYISILIRDQRLHRLDKHALR